jgi:hypothetical protein
MRIQSDFSESFVRELFNHIRIARNMKTRSNSDNGPAPAESPALDPSWLDQYPVEVLEAVLQILKAQRLNES